MSQFQQPELLQEDSFVVECFSCGEPLKIKRGVVLPRFWHCDPTPPRGAETARFYNAQKGIVFED